MGRLRPRSVFDVMAGIAFFIAIAGGGAYAAGTIGASDIKTDAVRSRHIKDGAVQNADLAARSVGTGKVINGSLLARDLSPDLFHPPAAHYVTFDDPDQGNPPHYWSSRKTIVEKGPMTLTGYCIKDVSDPAPKYSLAIQISVSGGTQATFTNYSKAEEPNGFGRAGATIPGQPGFFLVAWTDYRTSFFWYGGVPFSAITEKTGLDGVLSFGVLYHHTCEATFFGG
jgi:hypothetical protein